MLSEYRKPVYAGDRYNDNTLLFAYLKSIFSWMFFNRLCVFVIFFFFFFFFLRVYTLWKAEKKKKKHKNNNLQTGWTNTLLYRTFFKIIPWKERNVYVLSKELHQSVPYAQNESCLACK